MMIFDLTVQCPICNVLPGFRCVTGKADVQVHLARRVKSAIILKHPELVAEVTDWNDFPYLIELLNR